MTMTSTRRDFIALVAGAGAAIALPTNKDTKKPKTPKIDNLGEGRQSSTYINRDIVEGNSYVRMKLEPIVDGYYRIYLQEHKRQRISDMELVAVAWCCGGVTSYTEFRVRNPPRKWGLFTEFHET